MASLLEMRFASEGEEDDTEYEESSSNEGGSRSGSSSGSSSSDEETDPQQKQHQKPTCSAARRSRLLTCGIDGLLNTAAEAAAATHPHEGVAAAAVASFPAAASASSEESPAATAKKVFPGEEAALEESAVVAAATAAGDPTAASHDGGGGGEEGEFHMQGRKTIFGARQRLERDRKRARSREQTSAHQKKRRAAEQLKVRELFKEMQAEEQQALQHYPSQVGPNDFLLQFQRRCPPERKPHNKSWPQLQHHLSIAVSALRPSSDPLSSPQQLQQAPAAPASSPSLFSSSCEISSGVRATPAAVRPSTSAAVPLSPVIAATVAAVTEPAAAYTGAAVFSRFQEQPQTQQPSTDLRSHAQQRLPVDPRSHTSTQQRCTAAAGAGAPLSAALPQRQVPADATAIAIIADAAVAARVGWDKAAGTHDGQAVAPPPSAAAATRDAAAVAAEASAANVAADGSAQQRAKSFDTAPGKLAPGGTGSFLHKPTPTSAVASAAALSFPEVHASALASPPPTSSFSIKKCKERCRKNLSNATLVGMMQEALYNMENSGEVSVKKVVRFAGKILEVEERMEAASAKYQQMLEQQRRKPQQLGGRFSGLDGLVAALDGPPSVNTVQISQTDWDLYKRERGVAAELAKSHGFLKKQAFLSQAEWKQHEQNVEQRRRRQAQQRWAEQ